MGMGTAKEGRKGFGGKLLKLYGISLGLTAALVLTGAALFCLTGLPEGLYRPWMLLSLCGPCVLLGYGSAQIFGKRGLLTGLLTAAILLVFVLGTAGILLQTGTEINWFQPLYSLPLLAGAAGGFLGVGRTK